MNKPEPTDPRTSGWPQSRDGVAALVDAYANRLVRYAFRQVGNLQDAEDVVQDVFVRAFADRSRRAEVGAVGAYLYRAVGNACTDLLRRRNRAAVFREEVAVGELVGGLNSPVEARPGGRGAAAGGIAPRAPARRTGRGDPLAGFRRPAAQRDRRTGRMFDQHGVFPIALRIPAVAQHGR
jgi:hypothetical protein